MISLSYGGKKWHKMEEQKAQIDPKIWQSLTVSQLISNYKYSTKNRQLVTVDILNYESLFFFSFYLSIIKNKNI